MKITEDLVKAVRDFLGDEGVAFFRECRGKYGTVSPVLGNSVLPHPVHFREGMRVRNAMRQSGLCEGWTDHDYDEHWADIVEMAIKGIQ